MKIQILTFVSIMLVSISSFAVFAEETLPIPENTSDLATVTLEHNSEDLIMIMVEGESELFRIYKLYSNPNHNEYEEIEVENSPDCEGETDQLVIAQKTIYLENEPFTLDALSVHFCENRVYYDSEIDWHFNTSLLIYAPTDDDLELGEVFGLRLRVSDEGLSPPERPTESDPPPLSDMELPEEEDEEIKPEVVIPPLVGAAIAAYVTWRVVKKWREGQ